MRNAKREQSSSCHPAAVMPTTLATRSRHRKALSAVMFAALLMTMGCDASKRPNVVLVLIDALRKDHVGAFGYERDTTPFIDELAEQGTVFLRTVSQAPWTTPSMASIWTSKYPSWLGVGAGALPNGVRMLDASPPTGLSSGVPTLAEKLEENGYATIAVVANSLASEQYGLLRGFQSQSRMKMFANANLMVDRGMEQLAEHLDSGGEKAGPFFLYLHFMDVHEPTNPPEPFRSQFPVPDGTPHELKHLRWAFTELGAQDKPGFENFRDHKISLYDGSVAFVDSQVRRLTDLLRALGVLENTVLVIASDHGEELWDHLAFTPKFESHPYDGGAGAHGHSMLGELTDVPLIFYGNGVPQGRVERQVRNLDIAPTILGLAGIEDRSLQMEGVDLLSRSERASTSDLVSFSEDICYGYEVKALSDGRFKYLWYSGHPESLEFLFDRSVDPDEFDDLADDNPQVVAAMRTATQQRMAANERGRRKGEPTTLDAEDIEVLRALGYIE